MRLINIILVILYTTKCCFCDVLPNLPEQHLMRYLNAFPQIKNLCTPKNSCQLPQNSSQVCWGFELGCDETKRFQTPRCTGEHGNWLPDKRKQVDIFFDQADFGYIRQQRAELSIICTPKYVDDSALSCSKYLRFCNGRNLLIDFRDIPQRKKEIRYQMDVLKPGQFLGHCELNQTKLKEEMDHMGALQSWAPELRNFRGFTNSPILQSNLCDLTFNTPTFIMKIDSTYNMYHHFCDFINLYMSLFVNQTHPLTFDTNVRIIIWETYPYDSPFADAFKAFTKHPVLTLNEVAGKRVCFHNLVLPLLPRMIFGLYYNTPLIQGCQGSGMFRAFAEFMLHRLSISVNQRSDASLVRITFLVRKTKFRKVLNEEALLAAIRTLPGVQLTSVSYEKINFLQQLTITRNTDVLIGMHGAGLTHLIFLPEWATIFELYNCDDANCYKDLARLRGINYITWERKEFVYPEDEGQHPQVGAHAKFTNYAFDIKEFLRLVSQAVNYVRLHKDFKRNARKNNKDEL